MTLWKRPGYQNRVARVAMCCVVACGIARGAAAQVGDDTWAALANYKYGGDRKVLLDVQRAVAATEGNASQRAAVSAKLASFLAGDASYDAKVFCCQQLSRCASAAEVPVVARLLTDEKLSHQARHVLETIDDPSAGAALRSALSGLKGKLLAGVIRSIGNRRDTAAVDLLKPLTTDVDGIVSATALAALGRIGTPTATDVLEQVRTGNAAAAIRSNAAAALLECAETCLKGGNAAGAVAIYQRLYGNDSPAQVRIAALAGLGLAAPQQAVAPALQAVKGDDALALSAWGVLRTVQGPTVTRLLIESLNGLPPAGQAMLLDVLADRGDASARPAVLDAIKSTEATVRAAAIAALGRLGSVQEVGLLAGFLNRTGEEKDAARAALSKLRDSAADQAIAALVASPGDAAVRAELIGVLSARCTAAAVPLLTKVAADDADDKVRAAALAALGQLLEPKDAPLLVTLLTGSKTDGDRDAALKAIAAACARLDDRDVMVGPISDALGTAAPAAKAALLSALTHVDGERALAVVRAGLKDADPAIHDAAFRALTQWSSVAAVSDLLVFARGEDAKPRVLALRGMASIAQRVAAAAPDQAVNVCKQMLDASARPEDRKIALATLGGIKSASALKLAMPLLDDAALKEDAARSIVRIARLLDGRKEPAKGALQEVLGAAVSDAVKRQAADVMEKGK